MRHIGAEQIGDVAIVTLLDCKIYQGEMCQRIAEELLCLVEVEGYRRILLNFERVEYLSSNLIDRLVAYFNLVRGLSGKLIFCSVSPQISEVFEIMRRDKFFKFAPDQQAALQQF